jgi:hypothetical protein
MEIIISVHIDSVFKDPMSTFKDGYLLGACDNLAGILACAQLINKEGIKIEWTNDEEMHMDGARYIAKENSADNVFMLVVDVTERGKNWDKLYFTVENYAGIQLKHIKKALHPLNGHYKIIEKGTESEAWLYKDLGFACLEIDVPVSGGLHNLKNKARLIDILKVSEAISLVCDYLKDKDRTVLCDAYKPGNVVI